VPYRVALDAASGGVAVAWVEPALRVTPRLSLLSQVEPLDYESRNGRLSSTVGLRPTVHWSGLSLGLGPRASVHGTGGERRFDWGLALHGAVLQDRLGVSVGVRQSPFGDEKPLRGLTLSLSIADLNGLVYWFTLSPKGGRGAPLLPPSSTFSEAPTQAQAAHGLPFMHEEATLPSVALESVEDELVQARAPGSPPRSSKVLSLAVVTLLALFPAAALAEAPPAAGGAPAAPSYTADASWAALPERKDGADVVPPGASGRDSQREAKADVFYIHPTSTFDMAVSNVRFDDEKATAFLQSDILIGQASAFNAVAKVYAPRYRQATGRAFFALDAEGEKALELAYGDVERAFEHFITSFNKDRPFILAAHSQGALHLQRLLLSKVSGTPLVKRLVAVYAIGYPLPLENVPKDIPVATHEAQTGGLVSWNTFVPGADTAAFMSTFPVWVGGRYVPNGTRETVQVNPLNWSVSPLYAPSSLNLGSLTARAAGAPLGRVIPRVTGAQIQKVLYVDGPRLEDYQAMAMGQLKDNLHSYDYHLFYANIRENVGTRVRAFLGKTR
jgi:hypothetical protein